MGGYVIAGTTYSFGSGAGDVYLIKTNATGDTLCTRTYGGNQGYTVRQTSDGGYIITGSKSLTVRNVDVYLIKTDSLGRSIGVEETAGVRGQRLDDRIKAKPNPFTSFATVPGREAERFSLYDISGRRVGVYKGDRIGSGLSAGVYFLKLEGQDAKPIRIVKVR